MIDERVQERVVDVGVVAAWVTGWLLGAVAADDVDAALSGIAAHRVRGLDGDGGDGGDGAAGAEPFAAALIAWRRRGAREVRLVLPVPGEVRGLPADNREFTAAALAAGQVLVGGGLALVPELAGSGQLIMWQAYSVGPALPDPITVREATHDLASAVRETASVLMSANLGAPGVATADRLQRARRAGDRLALPPGHPGPAVGLLAQALRLRAVLDLAVHDPAGAAVDRTGMAIRQAALRPLITAVRRARMAACNAWAEPAVNR